MNCTGLCLFFLFCFSPVCKAVQSRWTLDLQLGLSPHQLASGCTQEHQGPGSPGGCSWRVGSVPLVEVTASSPASLGQTFCISSYSSLMSSSFIQMGFCWYLRSYRFMDMFPDTASIREIQQELDDIIQQGVRNITRLIRATDPNLTDPLQTEIMHGQTGSEATGGAFWTRGRVQRGSGGTSESSLASRLVRDGLLTPDLLKQLQREWSKEHRRQDDNELSTLSADHHEKNSKGKRKKKKKWRKKRVYIGQCDRFALMVVSFW